jgi:hypothetical protein
VFGECLEMTMNFCPVMVRCPVCVTLSSRMTTDGTTAEVGSRRGRRERALRCVGG